MGRKGAGLAARFRRAIRSERDEQAEQERARMAALEAARAAREALLGELGELGRAIGFVDVAQAENSVTFRYTTSDGARELVFEAVGDADRVGVRFTGQASHERHELYRQPELNDLWVWSRRRARREDRLPLFDDGLEELLVRGLGLPRPGEAEPESPGRAL